MTKQKVSNSTQKEQEVWRDIDGFEGLYKISNKGRVKSLERKARHSVNGYRKVSERILVVSESSTYPKVTLSKNGKYKDAHIHRLLGEHFIPNPENKPYVLHKDDDKLNYDLDNLYWGDQKKNWNDAIKNGKSAPTKGEECGTSKLTKSEVLEIRAAYSLGCFTHKELGLAYNVGRRQIGAIVNREQWTHI